MSDEEFNDDELQKLFDDWISENEEGLEEAQVYPEEAKKVLSEGYKDYHARLKNGFILLFSEFNLV